MDPSNDNGVLSPEQKNKLSEYAKDHILPIMGTIAVVGEIYIHRGEIAAYIHKHSKHEFKAGWINKISGVFREMGGAEGENGEIDIAASNMDEADLELFRETMSTAGVKKEE